MDDILQKYPAAIIDWVVEESFADILRLHPKINRIITVALRRWKKDLFSPQTKKDILSSIKNIKQYQYDCIIDTQGLLKSALIALFANGVRHGRDWQSNREAIASVFYQRRHHVPYKQHTVDRNRQLSALALNYTVPVTAPEYGLPTDTLSKVASTLNLPDTYVIILHSTSRDSKLWPVEYWVALGHYLNHKHLSVVLPWSNNAEFNRANIIACQLKHALVLPQLNLTQLAHICANAKAAIGVDTGLIHLAVALKIPSIAIYTDTQPALNGAYAAYHAMAINLGGVANMPTPKVVIQAFDSLNVT